ncbi:c-type cytochrome [Gimibacter soli]|uniref:Cytochrome c n=1 Tax=Gimibacter soli TaxID=3024400 RepID=A0AAE9XST2_9PROT|nr:cytochrome c [Gimibacter soli]WCL53405.1 cytochrome c [Gimibacter soli]
MVRPALAILTMIASSSAFADDAVRDARAAFLWKMNCQGCHQADARGSAGGAPDMRGYVSRFLSVDGGRAYLGRVPGVAFAPMSDADIANLLNWTLKEYDGGHIPEDFKLYSAEELGHLRKNALIENAKSEREALVRKLAEISQTN